MGLAGQAGDIGKTPLRLPVTTGVWKMPPIPAGRISTLPHTLLLGIASDAISQVNGIELSLS
jgi:hypothetical protein